MGEVRIAEDFEDFVRVTTPKLRRALLGAVGVERVDDAVAEALAWAFEHASDLATMTNPVGYLYRVGQSKSRLRKRVRLFHGEPVSIPEVEPGLATAMAALTTAQRTAIWLAHGCGWPHAEIAEVMEVSPSTVATHISRGLHRLRVELGVTSAFP